MRPGNQRGEGVGRRGRRRRDVDCRSAHGSTIDGHRRLAAVRTEVIDKGGCDVLRAEVEECVDRTGQNAATEPPRDGVGSCKRHVAARRNRSSNDDFLGCDGQGSRSKVYGTSERNFITPPRSINGEGTRRDGERCRFECAPTEAEARTTGLQRGIKIRQSREVVNDVCRSTTSRDRF